MCSVRICSHTNLFGHKRTKYFNVSFRCLIEADWFHFLYFVIFLCVQLLYSALGDGILFLFSFRRFVVSVFRLCVSLLLLSSLFCFLIIFCVFRFHCVHWCCCCCRRCLLPHRCVALTHNHAHRHRLDECVMVFAFVHDRLAWAPNVHHSHMCMRACAVYARTISIIIMNKNRVCKDSTHTKIMIFWPKRREKRNSYCQRSSCCLHRTFVRQRVGAKGMENERDSCVICGYDCVRFALWATHTSTTRNWHGIGNVLIFAATKSFVVRAKWMYGVCARVCFFFFLRLTLGHGTDVCKWNGMMTEMCTKNCTPVNNGIHTYSCAPRLDHFILPHIVYLWFVQIVCACFLLALTFGNFRLFLLYLSGWLAEEGKCWTREANLYRLSASIES